MSLIDKLSEVLKTDIIRWHQKSDYKVMFTCCLFSIHNVCALMKFCIIVAVSLSQVSQ